MSATSYVFEKFVINGVDTPQNPTQVVMDKDITVVAHYLVEQQMGTQPLKGEVEKQATAGETVTIKITKPDSTIETKTALTDATKAFSLDYTNVPGNYSAVASIADDALYLAAASLPYLFTLTKESRTITLHG